jgi:hypothetical protein
VDQVTASNSKVSMSGEMTWLGPARIHFIIEVRDRANDGQCANFELRKRDGGWQYIGHVCGAGKKHTFDSDWNLGGGVGCCGSVEFSVKTHEDGKRVTDVNRYGGA